MSKQYWLVSVDGGDTTEHWTINARDEDHAKQLLAEHLNVAAEGMTLYPGRVGPEVTCCEYCGCPYPTPNHGLTCTEVDTPSRTETFAKWGKRTGGV